jgi:3-oxoacyl-[acyl-carrier-protein] synthase II
MVKKKNLRRHTRMKRTRPVILGYDTVSPLGIDMVTQWDRASRGLSGVSDLTRFPLREGFPVRIAGQVQDIDTDAYPFLSSRDMALWTSPVFSHAMLVAHRALKKSGVEITADISPRVAITFSSAVGGLDAVIRADRMLVSGGKLPHPFTNANSCINMVGGKISIMTGATGPITSTITACATGSTSMIVGAMLIEQGMADVVICGAVDFPLVEPTGPRMVNRKNPRRRQAVPSPATDAASSYRKAPDVSSLQGRPSPRPMGLRPGLKWRDGP